VELVCVRHGRTAWNAERRFQGHTDIPLDAEGLAQAEALAVHLRPVRFDLALTSDLQRARTTAERICAGRAVRPADDAGLREMRFGAWEGLTWDEIVARWPQVDEAHEKSPRYYTAEGGESFEALCERVGAVIERTAAGMPAEGRALLVSHAGVMHAMLRVLLGPEREGVLRVRFAPASIMRFGGRPGAWELRVLNEVAPPLVTEGPR
jgi:broad specificity phosphatase PhoE